MILAICIFRRPPKVLDACQLPSVTLSSMGYRYISKLQLRFCVLLVKTFCFLPPGPRIWSRILLAWYQSTPTLSSLLPRPFPSLAASSLPRYIRLYLFYTHKHTWLFIYNFVPSLMQTPLPSCFSLNIWKTQLSAHGLVQTKLKAHLFQTSVIILPSFQPPSFDCPSYRLLLCIRLELIVVHLLLS